jgi:protein AbiQ
VQLKKLDNTFYIDNSHLKEVLDNHNGHWVEGKVRGYGVVIITINNLSFAIPLRSRIKHNASYITVKSDQKGIKGKGLDFTKALLISEPKYISHLPFKISADEYKKLNNKEFFVTSKFEKYVLKYIKAIQKPDLHILQSANYRFSTLCNYHEELGLSR